MGKQLSLYVRDIIGDARYAKLLRNDSYRDGYKEYREQFSLLRNKRKYVLLGCPDHLNIGDHAIAYAEKKMLESIGLPFIMCSGDVLKAFQGLESCLTPDDVIVLHGGGNMGDLYPWEELNRCEVISLMKKHRIVVFPQTMSYGDSADAHRFLRHTQRVYRRHPDLHLFARERVSFNRMRKAYPNTKVMLTPDIVLSLKPEISAVTSRKDVLFCVRNDVEKNVSDDVWKESEKFLMKQGTTVTYTDTTIQNMKKPICLDQGERAVHDKLLQFAHASLVVTDRLHGMIFSAITGTPCIAVNNQNGKVQAEYSWLVHLPYIHFAEDANDLPSMIEDMSKESHPEYSYSPHQFELLFSRLRDSLIH